MKPLLDFETLYRLARDLHQQNAHEQMQTIVHKAAELAGVSQACIVLFHPDRTIRAAFARLTDDALDVWEPLLEHGFASYAVHGMRTVLVRDVNQDPRWIHARGIPQTGAAVALPLIQERRVFGVLMLLHNQVDGFSPLIIKVLEEIAVTASASLPDALEMVNARYEYGFRQAPVSMILTDLNGSITDVNEAAAAWLGMAPTALIGQPITATHRLMTDRFKPQDMSDLQEGEEIAFRAVMHTASGELEPVLLRVRRVTLNGEPLVEFVGQDLSNETELEQLRTDLAAMIYHDLRNPLNTVKASMQRLAQMLANHDSDAVRALLQTGIRGTRQLKRMIDGLLDIQRLEEGSRIISARVVELRALLGDAVQLVQPMAVEAGITLRFQFEGDLPSLVVDDDMISRVVANLLENAIKYTEENGRITLRAYANEREIVISVRDSGPGIPYHLQSKIFDKFTRVKYQDAPRGVGLGLAFCKLAVEAHGGQIWVESEPGNGSEFIFTLPLERQNAALIQNATA